MHPMNGNNLMDFLDFLKPKRMAKKIRNYVKDEIVERNRKQEIQKEKLVMNIVILFISSYFLGCLGL